MYRDDRSLFRRNVALLISCLLLLFAAAPSGLAAAPLPPVQQVELGWDGTIVVILRCGDPPTDSVLLLPDGTRLTPDQLTPLPVADPAPAEWQLQFRLPAQTTGVTLLGCDGTAAQPLLIAQPPPYAATAVLAGSLLVCCAVVLALRRRGPPPTAAQPMTAQPWDLTVWDGRQEWVVPLRSTSVTLGHHGDCDVPLIGPAIAARHARLLLAADSVRLVDLGAGGGTFVGPIRRRLRAGETVTVQSDEEIVLGTSVRIRLTPAVQRHSRTVTG